MEPSSSSKIQPAVGCGLLVLGVAVFAVRLLHEGPYAMPRGGNLIVGLIVMIMTLEMALPLAVGLAHAFVHTLASALCVLLTEALQCAAARNSPAAQFGAILSAQFSTTLPAAGTS